MTTTHRPYAATKPQQSRNKAAREQVSRTLARHRPHADRYRFLLFCAAVATAVMWLGGCANTWHGIGTDLCEMSAPYCGKTPVSRKSPKSLDD